MKQFVLPPDYGGEDRLRLEKGTFHHLAHVLRIKPGDALKGIHEDNVRYTFRVESIERDSCLLERITQEKPVTRNYHITLFQCLLKGKKFDQVVRQATEAGADRIVPVASAYSIPRPEEKHDKLPRLRKIAREAVEQSGSPAIPEITSPVHLEDISRFWDGRGMALYCNSDHDNAPALHEHLSQPCEKIALFVGPEGGLSDSDTAILRHAGFRSLYLGRNILRSETAAVYALGAVNILLMEKERWKLKNHS